MLTHLVVALGVGNAALTVPAVGQREHNVAHVPVLVLILLQNLPSSQHGEGQVSRRQPEKWTILTAGKFSNILGLSLGRR